MTRNPEQDRPRLRAGDAERPRLVFADWGYVELDAPVPAGLGLAEPDSMWVDAFVGEGPLPGYLELNLEFRQSYDGELEVGALTIRPGGDHPEGGLVTDDLRLIRLGEATRKVRALVSEGRASNWGDDSPFGNPPMPPRDWARELARRPGRRGRDDQDYAEVAARYLDYMASPTPLKDLAAELRFSTSQVRNLLYEARRRGLLTGAPKGKAGGTLTDKARELLRNSAASHDANGEDHGK